MGAICHFGRKLEPRNKLQIQQPRGKPVRQRIARVRKILDQHVRYGIVTIDQVKHFQSSPDILKIPERIAAPAICLITVQQQRTEAEIDPYVRVYRKRIPVFNASGNIIRHVAAIKKVEIDFEIFVGREIILQKHSKRKKPVCGTPEPVLHRTDA